MTERILLGITQRCNQDCGYCIRKYDGSESYGPELTPFEIRQFVSLIQPHSVVLTGGEPTLRKDLDLILGALDGTRTGILTNGILTDRLISLKHSDSIGTIQYSIHGYDLAADGHISNIGRLITAYPDKVFVVVPVLSKRNIHTIEKALERLSDMGFGPLPADYFEKSSVEVKSNRMVAIHTVIPTKGIDPNLILHFSDWDLMGQNVRPYICLDSPAESYVRESLFSGRIDDRSCRFTIPVRADGEVMLCDGYYGPVSFGNIRDDPSGAILRRKRFMDKLDERRAEVYPRITQSDDVFRINCSRQIEKIFDDRELIESAIREVR